MKRTLLMLLVLCLFLSSCGIPGGSDSSSSDTPQETSAPDPVRKSSLLDNREAFDSSGTLWYIPNAPIEGQAHPMLYSFAGELLMTATHSVSDGQAELTLTLLSSATGEALQHYTVNSSIDAAVQLFDGHIAVCDSTTGLILILDAQLREVARHTLTPDLAQWFLGSDLDTLYKCSYPDGIHTVSLSTGEDRVFLDMAELNVCSIMDAGICFTGINRETQKYAAYYLDLASGALSEPPFSDDFSRIAYSGGMWLASLFDEEGTFAFGTGAEARYVTAPNGTFSLLDPTGQLLFTSFDGELSLYDSTGAFLSSCMLSGRYVQTVVWLEELDGYLLLVSDSESTSRLLFWDIHAGNNGKDLETQSHETRYATPGGTSADASLYKRAQALSDRFGLEILIADQCGTEFSSFTCHPVSDYETISESLDILEYALSIFPEGFFSQLLYGHIRRVQVQLIGGLTAKEGFYREEDRYNGFADTNGSMCCIVLDIDSLSANTVWHELSHIIDVRLAWDATCRKDALFSEEGWSSYNPSDFAYTESYSTRLYEFPSEWRPYFVDSYAMTNATEDRARIFEFAIDCRGTLFQDAGLRAKLQYYSDCIRDCFDTTHWPETMPWEVPLR